MISVSKWQQGDSYSNLPKEVKIGSIEWTIEISEIGDSTARGEFGHTNIVNQKIRIKPGLTDKMLANTWLHEVLHAIHWDQGLWHGEPDEEDYTNQGANGLCTFFQLNPSSLAWFCKANQ